MRRIAIAVALALMSFALVSCGGGNDASTVSNTAPFVGEKFTLTGSVDAEGARPVALESSTPGRRTTSRSTCPRPSTST